MKTNYIVETDTDTLTFPVDHEGLEAAIKVANEAHTNVDVQVENADGSYSYEEVWNFIKVWREALA